MSRRRLVAALPLLTALAACGTESALPESVGYGAAPQLPEARPQRIPTVKIAPAVGWPAGRTPVAAQGLAVNAFATGLDHPRWLYELPNGDVLVAESNAPPKPDDKTGGLPLISIGGEGLKPEGKTAGKPVAGTSRGDASTPADAVAGPLVRDARPASSAMPRPTVPDTHRRETARPEAIPAPAAAPSPSPSTQRDGIAAAR